MAVTSVPAHRAEAAGSLGISWALRLPYPLRNAVSRWRTLLSMILGVGIALSIGMTILAVISAEMDLLTGDYERSAIGVYASTQGGKIVARLAGDTPGTIQNAATVLAQVRGWPEVHHAVGALTWTMAREQPGPRRRGQPTELVSVIGVDGDPQSVPNMLVLDSGRWLRGGNEVVVGRTLAKDKGLHVGDTLRMNGSTFSVVGVGTLRGFSAFGQNSVAYMDDRTLVQRAQVGNVLNVIAIDWVLIILTLGVAGLFVNTMLNHSVVERRAEFAVLRAIGFPGSWIVMTVALESLTITVAAGLVAVAISLLLGSLLNATVAQQYGFDSLYRADPSLFMLIFGLAAALGVVSGVLPARKAASVDPVEVLRES